MSDTSKITKYTTAAREIAAIIHGENNLTARMATVSNILHHSFDHFFWTGFYQVDLARKNELVIGPYQGTLGCLRIPFGKGVCGTVAQSKSTLIVDDVHEFPGHIACDANSRSEIVVPVFNAAGEMIAVLDVDSDTPSQFDAVDREHLEAIVKASFAALG